MGRAPCCEKQGLKKGPWTPDEDKKLIAYIQQHGHGSWRSLPKHAGLLRCGKSCRLRWTNYLRPDIKRGNFSSEEEHIIISLHALLGNRWSSIASHLQGRTDNEIKNYWNTHLKKRLLQMGLDPVSHKPLMSDASGMGMCSKFPFGAATHQRIPWESSVRQCAAPSHGNFDITDDGFGTENQSSDYFLRAWRSDAGEVFRKGLNFSDSYLQQLRSCGLDISGFLVRARHTNKNSSYELENAMGSNVNMPLTLVENQSPSSALSSVDCSITQHMSFGLHHDSKGSEVVNTIEGLGKCGLHQNRAVMESAHEPSMGSLTTYKPVASEAVVKQEDLLSGGEASMISALDYDNHENGNWDGGFMQDDKSTGHICDLDELTPSSLQWSQAMEIDHSLGFTDPKQAATDAIKKEMCSDKDNRDANLNGCQDLGHMFFMPLLAPEDSTCLDFGHDGTAQLTAESELPKCNMLGWQDQFVSAEASAHDGSSGELYWSSLMKGTVVLTTSLQPNCTNATA
ncbi:hypothetical protein KP509_03G079300 [Ceratopteris richardii]|uniref:Uncharacterized protein n=1 Tax=Ceratopteris richardii TaxID=49495 RepID=A0A8T2V5E8_CERRI|nr:hypothetical protein KP509_03G079300 [Ceratopteris richardii]